MRNAGLMERGNCENVLKRDSALDAESRCRVAVAKPSEMSDQRKGEEYRIVSYGDDTRICISER